MERGVAQMRSVRFPALVMAGFAAASTMFLSLGILYGLSAWFATINLAAGASQVEMVRGWFFNMTHNNLVDFGRTNFYYVALGHLALSMGWALVYGILAEPYLRGAGWERGALFALVPFILSLVLFLPLFGAGMFGLDLKAGPLPIMGSALVHLVYGISLGAVYGPFGAVLNEEGSPSEGETRMLGRSERMAAVGIVTGAGLGLVAGAVLAATGNPGALAGTLDIPPAALTLVLTALGGALGGLIGSMAGLSTPTSSALAVRPAMLTATRAPTAGELAPSEPTLAGGQKHYSLDMARGMQKRLEEHWQRALAQTDIFGSLSWEELQTMTTLGQMVTLHPGEALAHQGLPGEAIYAILEGQVELSAALDRGDITIRVAGPGEALPLACVLGDGNLVTSACAMTEVRALRILRQPLLELCAQRPELAAHLYRSIAEVAMERYRKTVGRLTGTVAQVLRQSDIWANV